MAYLSDGVPSILQHYIKDCNCSMTGLPQQVQTRFSDPSATLIKDLKCLMCCVVLPYTVPRSFFFLNKTPGFYYPFLLGGFIMTNVRRFILSSLGANLCKKAFQNHVLSQYGPEPCYPCVPVSRSRLSVSYLSSMEWNGGGASLRSRQLLGRVFKRLLRWKSWEQVVKVTFLRLTVTGISTRRQQTGTVQANKRPSGRPSEQSLGCCRSRQCIYKLCCARLTPSNRHDGYDLA